MDVLPGFCERCGEPVLFVMLADDMVAVEPWEVEYPPVRCPVCHGGRRVEPCLRCGGAGWVGDELPVEAVALDEGDCAHRWSRRRRRRDGWALHRAHECDLAFEGSANDGGWPACVK